MESDDHKGMLYGATGIALFVVVFVLFKAKAHFAAPSTEQELVAHLHQTTPRPNVVPAPRDYADSDRDEVIEQYFLDAMRDLEAAITECIKRWPGAPAKAKSRLRTDKAGRLEALSIQGAPAAAEACLATVFQGANLPRRANAVVHLVFPGIREKPKGQGPGPNPDNVRSLPPGEIYWGEAD